VNEDGTLQPILHDHYEDLKLAERETKMNTVEEIESVLGHQYLNSGNINLMTSGDL
jgi:hypothetical protein